MGLRWRHRPSTGTGRTLTAGNTRHPPAALVGRTRTAPLCGTMLRVCAKPRSALAPCGVSVGGIGSVWALRAACYLAA